VWDTDGRKYLDFSAGIAVNALGHADEGFLKVGVHHFSQLVRRPVSLGVVLPGVQKQSDFIC